MAFQVLSLFLLALPIASIAWTITHEEVVREFRDVCLGKSTLSQDLRTQVLLSLYVRVLLQPLRDSRVSDHHPF
jgi:hypothetical protein